ncbi:MAG: homoserine kinase, partial [Pseudomonadota bacterium]
VTAVNQMLKIPLNPIQLYPYALAGETAASGEAHGDNVGPALLGGLTVSVGGDEPRVVQVPVPNQLRCVLVHPRLRIETRDSRGILPDAFDRRDVVQQMSLLSGFITGCFQRDLDLIEASLADLLVEPVRSPHVPGFGAVKAAALECGAMGCSLSGSGPSVFAWFRSEATARTGADAMREAFAAAGHESECYVSSVNSPGARQA